jgi:DNA-binding IscR family transcriptional regulator
VDGSGGDCEARGLCPVHGRWDRVNDAIHQALMGITLADMARPKWQPAPRAHEAAALPLNA